MARAPKPRSKSATTSPLVVRMDLESKEILARAAELRKVSVSDYVRTVALLQARREVIASEDNSVALTADEQLAFWQALHEPTALTSSQKHLGSLMRGDASPT